MMTSSSSEAGSAEPFLRGVSVQVFQQSGDDGTSNWSAHLDAKQRLLKRLLLPHQALKAKGSNFWRWYEQDIRHCAELGSNAFRVNFEWARLQPHGPNTPLDLEACQRYDQVLDCMVEHGIEPIMVLHHFTHPQWFEDMGAFEKEENLGHFEAYCVAVFRKWGGRVKRWATINEPTSYTLAGYVLGVWPPARFLRAKQTGLVLANMLRAHLRVYRTLKQLPGGQEAQVGLIHHHLALVPRYKLLLYTKYIAKWVTKLMGTYNVLDFFQTGTFSWETPFGRKPEVLLTDEGVAQGEKVFDWWGINYYTRPAVQWDLEPGPANSHELCSDRMCRLYPQGLYEAIKEGSVFKVPIYLTEIGLPDNTDHYRDWYIRAAFGMILRAIADGYDVRGALWWTLNDDLEWNGGYMVKMGLYEWHTHYVSKYKDTGNRPPEGLRLKEGAKALPQIYRAWPQRVADVRKYASEHAWHTQPAYVRPDNAPAGPIGSHLHDVAETVASNHVMQRYGPMAAVAAIAVIVVAVLLRLRCWGCA